MRSEWRIKEMKSEQSSAFLERVPFKVNSKTKEMQKLTLVTKTIK